MNRQSIPEAAVNDPDSVEMLTVWIAERSLHCSIKVGMYTERQMDEVSAWGRILADAARHISNALSEMEGRRASDALDGIRASFEEELDRPTSDTKGKFVRRN